MSQRLPGTRPVTATGRRCVIQGCAVKPAAGAIICGRHAEALRRPSVVEEATRAVVGTAPAPDHVMIPLDELQEALGAFKSCPVCDGGLGICVEAGDWEVVELHSTTCTYRRGDAS